MGLNYTAILEHNHRLTYLATYLLKVVTVQLTSVYLYFPSEIIYKSKNHTHEKMRNNSEEDVEHSI